MKVKELFSSVVILATLFATAIPLRATSSSFAVSAGGSQYSSEVIHVSDHQHYYYNARLTSFEFYGLGSGHAPTSSTVIHVRPYSGFLNSQGDGFITYSAAGDVADFTCADNSTWSKQKGIWSGHGYVNDEICLKTNSSYSLKGYYCTVIWSLA